MWCIPHQQGGQTDLDAAEVSRPRETASESRKKYWATRYDWNKLFAGKNGYMDTFQPFSTIQMILCDPRLTPAAKEILCLAVLATDNKTGKVGMSKTRLSANFAAVEEMGQLALYLNMTPIHDRRIQLQWYSPIHLCANAKRGFPAEDLERARIKAQEIKAARTAKRKCQKAENQASQHTEVGKLDDW